jgi:hypothetical protein
VERIGVATVRSKSEEWKVGVRCGNFVKIKTGHFITNNEKGWGHV